MDSLANVFARNCAVRRIDRLTAREFLDENHRLGSTSGRYFYGLFITRSTGSAELELPPGTLAAVSVFSNARRWLKDGVRVSSYEWVRYASLKGIRVTGGMGKALRAFIDDVRPDDIMSYADLSYPDGGAVYSKLGFTLEGIVKRDSFRCAKYRLKLYGASIRQSDSLSTASCESTPAASRADSVLSESGTLSR